MVYAGCRGCYELNNPYHFLKQQRRNLDDAGILRRGFYQHNVKSKIKFGEVLIKRLNRQSNTGKGAVENLCGKL